MLICMELYTYDLFSNHFDGCMNQISKISDISMIEIIAEIMHKRQTRTYAIQFS